MVLFQRRGPLLDVIALAPEIVHELVKVLTTVSHGLDEQGRKGCQIATSHGPICSAEPWCRDSTQFVFSTLRGFEPVVTQILRGHGIEIDRTALDGSKLVASDVGEHLAPVLRALPAGGSLVVRHGPAIYPAALAAELCRALAGEQIAVVTARRCEVLDVRDELRARRIEVVAITSQGEPVESGRVVVGTFSTMGCGCASIERRRVVIALNSRETMCESGRLVLTHAESATVIGLLPFGSILAPRDYDYVRGYFGFSEWTMPTYATKVLPISTKFIKLECGPPVVASTREDVVLRTCIWQNSIRNRQIKRLVRAQVDAGLRVGVFVEAWEHANALQRLLPHCAMISSRENLDRLYAGNELYTPSVALFTGTVVDGVPWDQLDVLVRADGGTGLPALAMCESTINVASDHELLLVDFDDRFHPEFRRRSRWRREAYEDAGWFAHGLDPVAGRVASFIAAKRGGQS